MLTLNDGRSELWQWDTGRTLAVDADCSQVHFSNKVFGRSIDVDVVDGTAIIPDILLQTDKDLNVWAFVGTAENGCPVGYKVVRAGKLWKLRQEHTSQDSWAPGETGTESLWEEICEQHDGTKYDPIPYSGNMALENGKYYTQYGVLYKCTRDTGNPVYHALSALVGTYVEVVENGF